ncbi:hypothetical protein K1719_041001 [Acacia pycnantha]|nr:hypothetical protein K1719_041001 [Acacia pycnantha]
MQLLVGNNQIADGMTIQIHTVNLLLETRGGACSQGGSTWAPPMASITICNLLLYTTNEEWQFCSRDDSVVEIQGESSGVHKAVELIATHLRKFLVDQSIVGVFETQSLLLLTTAIFDRECEPLFSLEIYGHIIGMFEENNLDLVVASPSIHRRSNIS